jgi:SAM-dependent methyltransferase
MRHLGGVIQSTAPHHAARAAASRRWLTSGFSAIGSSNMGETHHIFDRRVYILRQAKAAGEGANLLDQRVAEELAERLAVINRKFAAVALIASRTERFATALAADGKCLKITVLQPYATDDLKLMPDSFDAAVSVLDLQTVNDVPGYLAQAARALRPDGLALFAFFAGDTLRELREAWLAAETEITGGVTPRIAPMIDLREAGGLLQRAGLALPVADLDRVTLRYSDALALMREIKDLGFANPLAGRSQRFVSRRLLQRVVEIYHSHYAGPDGRIPVTIEIAWAMAWKPHASQQQPLKPGSAKQRLAETLEALKDKG